MTGLRAGRTVSVVRRLHFNVNYPGGGGG